MKPLKITPVNTKLRSQAWNKASDEVVNQVPAPDVNNNLSKINLQFRNQVRNQIRNQVWIQFNLAITTHFSEINQDK